jgi:hypothetical protein
MRTAVIQGTSLDSTGLPNGAHADTTQTVLDEDVLDSGLQSIQIATQGKLDHHVIDNALYRGAVIREDLRRLIARQQRHKSDFHRGTQQGVDVRTVCKSAQVGSEIDA